MKRLIVIVFALLFSLSAIAQDHLCFKAIPIEGSLKSFISKLTRDGYSIQQIKDDYVFLTGTFAGFDNCQLIVLSTPVSKTTCKIGVFLPDQKSWFLIKSRYESLLKSYVNKYGEPRNSYNFFSAPYREGDGLELLALKQEKAGIAAYWFFSQGSISIEVKSFDGENGYIAISYEDKSGIDLMDTENQDVVNNDI